MLNLEAKTKSQQLILAYLEENATETLIEKINNGVQIEKDGVQLINKKTMNGFAKYAENEAKKLAEQGEYAVCVDDPTVYGWAMHYFEEDSIEGTLYNLDGTEYKKPSPKPSQPVTTKKTTPVKKETEHQFSIFDLSQTEEQAPEQTATEKPTLDEILEYNIDENHDNDEDEEPSDEMKDALKHIEAEKQANQPKPKITPIYEKYLELEKQNPNAVVIMRLGDFYEVFGENAVQLANELNMTLTSRDCGLPERIPLIGFPCHAAYNYFVKIGNKHNIFLYEKDDETSFLPMRETKASDEKHWTDATTYVDNDGVIHKTEREIKESVNKEIPDWIIKTFNNKVIVR